MFAFLDAECKATFRKYQQFLMLKKTTKSKNKLLIIQNHKVLGSEKEKHIDVNQNFHVNGIQSAFCQVEPNRIRNSIVDNARSLTPVFSLFLQK